MKKKKKNCRIFRENAFSLPYLPDLKIISCVPTYLLVKTILSTQNFAS